MIPRLGRGERLHAGEELKSPLHLLLRPSMQFARCCIASTHTFTRTLAHTTRCHLIATTLSSRPMFQGKGQHSKMAPKRGAYMLHTCFVHASYMVPARSIASCLLTSYFGQRSKPSLSCLLVSSQRRDAELDSHPHQPLAHLFSMAILLLFDQQHSFHYT